LKKNNIIIINKLTNIKITIAMYKNFRSAVIVIAILLSIYSCRTDEKPALKEYFINHKNAESPIRDIIESYDLIQLEETEGAFFSNARRIIFNDGKIIILTGDNRILTFRESGEFIGAIDKQGRGPDEYVSLQDICLDRENNQIIASCATKVIWFSPGGDIIDKLDPGFRFSSVQQTGPGNLLFDIRLPGDEKDFNYNLVLTDRKLNLIHRRLELPLLEGPGLALYGQFTRTSGVAGEDYFFSLLCDTLYRIRDKEISPDIVFNYEKEIFSITATGEPEWEDTYNMVSYSETDNYSLLGFRYDKDFYTTVIRKGEEGADIYEGIFNVSGNYADSFIWPVYSSSFTELIDMYDPQRNKCSDHEMLKHYLENPEEISSLLIKVNIRCP